MIVYEYKCKSCGVVKDIPKGQTVPRCDICGGELSRKFSRFGINGFADKGKKMAVQEKRWQKETEKEAVKQREADKVEKDADVALKKMYGELMTTRTPARDKHLKRRSTPGTREHQEYKEYTGMEGD